jgi:hypothetical protein
MTGEKLRNELTVITICLAELFVCVVGHEWELFKLCEYWYNASI